MKVLDANLVLYAYLDTAPEHAAALAWLQEAFASPAPVGIPLQSIAAFLRIMTHQRLKLTRLSIEEAVATVDDWLALPHVSLMLPTERHWHFLKQALLGGKASGDLITDAQIAASAYEYEGIVETDDRDFARFPGLRWHNPLLGSSALFVHPSKTP